MRRSAVAATLWFFLATLHAQEELALRASEEAWNAYRVAQNSLAASLAKTAIEFDSSLSDPYVVLALLPDGSVPLRQRAGWARSALERNRFVYSSSGRALEIIARYDLDGGRADSVEALLGPRPETALDPVLSGLYIEALLARGRREAARSLLSQARQRFPGHRALLGPLLSFPRDFPETETRLLAAVNGPGWGTADTDSLLRNLPSLPLDRTWVLTRLQKTALRSDPDVAAQLVSSRLLRWEEALGIWEENGLPRDLQVAQALSRLVPQTARERWNRMAAAQSVSAFLAKTPGSLYDEQHRYDNGLLSFVSYDRDGDGMAEGRLELRNGLPGQWSETLVGDHGETLGTVRLKWSAYPLLEAMEMSRIDETGSHRKVFQYIPDGTRFLIAGVTGAVTYPGTQQTLVPDAERAASLAVRLLEYDSAGLLRRRWSLENGRAYLLEEDTRGAGYRDAVYLFELGQLRTVYRDPEGAGRWSVVQTLERGRLTSTSSSDQNGRLRLVWLNLQPGLFLWDEGTRQAGGPVFQEGLVSARLALWEEAYLPVALGNFPPPPFSELEEWP